MNVHVPTGLASASRPADLAAIRDPAVSAVIWRRDPPGRFLCWLDALRVDLLPVMRSILPVADVSEAIVAACDAAGTPPGPERDLLVEDVTHLAATVGNLIAARHLRVRLNVVAGDGCPKFHVDHVAARLLCTYRGTGTEIRQEGRIETLLAGDVALMRGTDWPGGAPGAEHRSPRRNAGGVRLLLAIDPIFDPEEAM